MPDKDPIVTKGQESTFRAMYSFAAIIVLATLGWANLSGRVSAAEKEVARNSISLNDNASDHTRIFLALEAMRGDLAVIKSEVSHIRRELVEKEKENGK